MERTDPYREPDNSTVEDWHGQEVARDTERAEELLEEAEGDPKEAEERFDQEQRGPARRS